MSAEAVPKVRQAGFRLARGKPHRARVHPAGMPAFRGLVAEARRSRHSSAEPSTHAQFGPAKVGPPPQALSQKERITARVTPHFGLVLHLVGGAALLRPSLPSPRPPRSAGPACGREIG